jgi:hypothetical protein
MFRRTTAILIALLLVPAASSQTGLRLGEKFEGELKGEKKPVKGFSDNRAVRAYTAEIPVTLKAGQKLFLTVTVAGKTRLVGVALRDPSGALVEKKDFEKKSIQLEIEEVSASGKCHIVVLSDQIGAFTLRATGPAEKLDAKALREKIKRLERELEEARDLLKKAEAAEKGAPK